MSIITTLPKLYTEDEAGAYLGLSEVTMRRLRARKRISFIPVGRSIRYTDKHLTDYLESQTCHASESQTNTPSSSEKGQTTGISNGASAGKRSAALRALDALTRPASAHGN